eukprot:CAMPEP_0204826674 /NCGR_PEP_ID=MMETSP1346-20131115/4303_1 /ASSEMBLY_ACC=CAM_ASM_000771 /TAXON_ID=215587 /ORGANISM="Aplanochytrium stocchinoi, Strain GSBS06" /LENGTH=431 /DNA_ID=CAMNT_0051954781 /DNA_START=417 /DNA_END=1712 /DNA_ORIENTATION=+
MSVDVLSLESNPGKMRTSITTRSLNTSLSSVASTGISQLVGDKDQDRFVVKTTEEDKPDYFAVFDGHGQFALAADMSADHLYDLILDIDAEIANADKSPEDEVAASLPLGPLVPTDEAIVQAFHIMHDDIVAKAKETNQMRTGTCALCLFLGEPTQKDIQRLAADKSEATSEPAAESEAEDENRGDADSDSNSIGGNTSGTSSKNHSFAKIAWVGDSKCIMVDHFNNPTELTVDHRVSTNPNEVKRIQEMSEKLDIREGLLESEFWENEVKVHEEKGKKPRPKSYIGQRSYNGQPRGPHVLFSYSNGISLQISRTLGDPLAARSATAEPEIAYCDISDGQHYRFVLASDGVWDVFTPKEIANILKKYPDPQHAGQAISYQAKNKRMGKGLNNDDITTIVIEVNPHMRVQKSKGSFLNLGSILGRNSKRKLA